MLYNNIEKPYQQGGLIELTDSRISYMNQILTEQVNACYFVNKTALKDNSIHVL